MQDYVIPDIEKKGDITLRLDRLCRVMIVSQETNVYNLPVKVSVFL